MQSHSDCPTPKESMNANNNGLYQHLQQILNQKDYGIQRKNQLTLAKKIEKNSKTIETSESEINIRHDHNSRVEKLV